MSNRKISADLKECALNLWNTGWDIEDIRDALGVSRASIYRWEAIFAEYGAVNRPPSPIHLYLDEVVTWLALTYDISISVSTL
ncbi:hypothetical protein F4604DRAFT_1918573 [Suillus subluteus]|nr:hypothetical protein F4604DRAFT_1918573 [Suillus subluteus]